MTDPERQSPITPAQELNDLVRTVDEHNAQFSSGNAMASLFIEMANKHMAAEELERKDQLPREAAQRVLEGSQAQKPGFAEQRDMSKDLLALENSPVLSGAGLMLTPVRANMVVMGSGHGDQEVGPVRLQLADGEKFADFLTQLNPGEVDETTSTNIQKLVGSILQENEDAVFNNTDGESVMETLAAAGRITGELGRLGLGDSPAAAKLKSYAEHSKKGDLVEFIAGTKMQLFREPEEQQFGPAKWQRDASAEFLQNHWDEVIALLRKAKANPSGADIFNQLLNGAKQSLDAARADWAEHRGESSIDGYGAAFDGVFNEVAAQLQHLEQS